MSLRLRLALLFAAATAVVIAAAAAMFLWQLRAAQIAALDAGLRVRADAVEAQVSAGGLPSLPAQGGQQGQNQGEFPTAEAESQVLAPQGTVLYSSAGSGQLPLVTGEWLRRAAAGTVTFITSIEGESVRVLAFPGRDGSRPVLRPGEVDLPVLLSAAARAFAGQARVRDVTLEVRAGPALTVTADRDRLRQAVDNLLSNAIRHSPAGGTVNLAAARTRRGGQDLVIIEVCDEGPGFPPGFLPHVFERFSRADVGRGRAEGGTGLGLAIVDFIARAHGGRAAAINRPGGGAQISVEIPDRG